MSRSLIEAFDAVFAPSPTAPGSIARVAKALRRVRQLASRRARRAAALARSEPGPARQSPS